MTQSSNIAAPLAVGETVSTASPKVELGKSKAVVAVLVGLGVPGIGAYVAPTTVTRKQ